MVQLEIERKKKIMLTTSFYLLLTISIVPKYLNCYVVENDAIAKSKADDSERDYASYNDDTGNQMEKTVTNLTEADNQSVIFDVNDAVDYSTMQRNTGVDTLTEVESGKINIFILYSSNDFVTYVFTFFPFSIGFFTFVTAKNENNIFKSQNHSHTNNMHMFCDYKN